MLKWILKSVWASTGWGRVDKSVEEGGAYAVRKCRQTPLDPA